MAEAIQKIADGKFVKVGGWQIPQTDLMRRHGSGRGHIYAESGDLVDTEFESFYAPLVKIYSFDNEKQAGLTAGLEVETIVKVSVGGNVFAIEITGILVRSKDGSVEPVQIGPATFERFLDSDGDGVFETYIVDSSQMKVPAWAYTNK